MQSALVTLELGQTYVFSVSPLKEHAQLYYRGLSETAWKHFTSAVTIKVPCSGGINMYEFIFTSTGDRNTDGALLSVTRQSKQNCKCKRQDDESCPVDPAANSTGGFVLYPLLDPAASGAKCPPGTHGAINAPWCCPDGTELDQAIPEANAATPTGMATSDQ
ncbi:hypothetical protein H2199_008766 [Coniosporium tulheliwenetii]|uniref:Uncharacterized protein n=1 Tax=Coniosporium tulheliwenetii TaxID=3383036 RepID=A0ACC2YHY4_9PEZI|nr:hypothetical protein H2199_008766 [Cladosporium sp. JES 115]